MVAYFLLLNYSMSKCPEVKYGKTGSWVFLDMTIQEAGSRASFCSLGNQVQEGREQRKPECPGPTWPSAQWAGWSLVPKAPSSKLGPDPHLFRLSSPQEQGWRCVGDM